MNLAIESNHESEFSPGDIVRARISLDSSTADYTALKFNLIGETEVNIMGIDRWQAGAAANIGSGGSSMLITSIEALQFVKLPCELISPDSISAQQAAQSEKTKKSAPPNGCMAEAGLYQVVIPSIEGQVLPSWIKHQDDLAGVSVTYYLELIGERKGFLKKNDKLRIDIPVTIPRFPRSDQSPSSITATRELKFTSTPPLFVTAILSHAPLSHSTESLAFTLTLIPSPSARELVQPPKLVASLARRIRTTPISKPGNGKEFDWAGINIARGEMMIMSEESDKRGEGREDDGTMTWKGVINVPRGEATVESRGLGIRYMLGVQLSDPTYTSTLSIKLPVFLPSSPHALEYQGGYHHVNQEGEDQLPTYAS